MSQQRFTPKVDPIIAQIHAAFVKISQRDEPARLAADLWTRLLACEEYQGDAKALERDACFLARYLVAQISRGVRYPGALKAKNLLQEAKFFEDLAEAKQQNSKAYKALLQKKPAEALDASKSIQTIAPTPEDAIRTEAAAGLRALREQLGGLPAEEVEKLKSAQP